MIQAYFEKLRAAFHTSLLEHILTVTANGVPSNADSSSQASKRIAKGILSRLGKAEVSTKLPGQTMGASFEASCAAFVRAAFDELSHLRPGDFHVRKGGGIAEFDQYEHLDDLEQIAKESREIATALGADYLIKPDIVVFRFPESDAVINASRLLVDDSVATRTSLRADLGAKPILHASISCKWTLRSDRAQNARSEGLNLVRNRKGHLPHIAVVTGEPLPSRISSLALGTGDIDCVYHFALSELIETLSEQGDEGYADQLHMMIEGKRLRDIADLPLDLVV